MRISAMVAVLVVALAGGANGSAEQPAPPAPVEADLVVLDVADAEALRERGLSILWRDADFILAEWNDRQKLEASEASLSFEIVGRRAASIPDLHLFEIDLDVTPPAEWPSRLVYRHGRKWILRMSAAEADAWSQRGFQPVRIPREPREWRTPASVTAFDCSSDPLIADLLAQAGSAQWLDWIEKLSGEETVSIGGADHESLTRYSSTLFSGQEYARGFDFVLEQVGSWHYGPTNLEVHSYEGTLGETWKNLIVTIPGRTLPNEIVMMTAHLDSTSNTPETYAPGADDNGSGSATLLEAARLFRQYRFDRTIKIAWFTGEEQGLYGSEAYVEDHATAGIVGVVNLDMMGWDGDGDSCFEIHAGTLASSIEIGQCYEDSLSSYGLPLSNDFLTSDATTFSDHSSFWQVGVGAIEIAENFFDNNDPGGCAGEDRNPNYHRVEDRVDGLALPFASDIARAGLATVAAMALPIDACFDESAQITASPGEARIDLQWTPVPGAVRYRVYRSTQGCEGQWLEIAQTSATSWADLDAVEARVYNYQVEAIALNVLCVSAPSNCAAAIPVVYHASAVDAVILDVCPAGGAGSGDGVADPGESLLLPTHVENDGSVALSRISGELSVSTPGASVLDPHAEWPDLGVSGHAQSLPNHFGVALPSGAPCGTPTDATLSLTYDGGSNETILSIPVGRQEAVTLLEEDFTTGIPGDWVVVDGGSGGGAAATWTASNPGARWIALPFSDPFAIVDSDSAGSGAFQNEQLIAPTLDASSCNRLTLIFDNQFRWYSGGQHDVGDIDVSTDGGQNWATVLRLEGASDGYQVPVERLLDLTPFIAADPTSVSVRFHYHQASNEWWWAIDNVRVECQQSVCIPCAGPIPPPGEPGLLTVDKDSGQIVFDWDGAVPGCIAEGYALYRGDLPTLRTSGYNHATAVTCAAGSTSFAIDASSLGAADYYLVVNDNGLHEGSYGRDSKGAERPASAAACRAGQNITDCWPGGP